MKYLYVLLVLILSGCAKNIADQGDMEDIKRRVWILEQALANTVVSLQNIITQANTDRANGLADSARQDSNIAALQSNANAQQVQLTVIQMGDTIIKMVDPCGTTPGFYNEVLLRTTGGKLVAYFESGTNRYLSILSPGNYATTDGTGCNFTVDNDLKVCNQTIVGHTATSRYCSSVEMSVRVSTTFLFDIVSCRLRR